MSKRKHRRRSGIPAVALTEAVNRLRPAPREAEIAELMAGKADFASINRTYAGLSAECRSGLLFEQIHKTSFNGAAARAGDTGIRAELGRRCEPRVDLRVRRDGVVVQEIQAKVCGTAKRTAVAISDLKYQGTKRLVAADQAQDTRAGLLRSAEAKANSADPAVRMKATIRQEAGSNVTDRIEAGGHQSRPITAAEARAVADGDYSQISRQIAIKSCASAALGGAKAGAVIGGGFSVFSNLFHVATGQKTGMEAGLSHMTFSELREETSEELIIPAGLFELSLDRSFGAFQPGEVERQSA